MACDRIGWALLAYDAASIAIIAAYLIVGHVIWRLAR